MSNAYDLRRYRKIGYGTWKPLVDAEPVRQHIAALRAAGHSLPRIQKTAQVSAATIARILYDSPPRNPRAQRIRTEVAQRILALPIEPAPITPTTVIDATGTRRRIQALVTIGWPYTLLGPHLGFHPRRLTELARGERVLASTARRIADAYRTVQTWDPAQHGVPLAARTMARNLAAREGWHGPLAWEDIDDPSCRPEKTPRYEPIAANGRDSMRRDEIRRLVEAGESEHFIAKKLGLDLQYTHDLCREARKAAA
ncbi:hypothetical protein CG740_23320 [Streptomyces sp. CB01201]|uniref:hypothetical protein n=1 Tax=Streptomyces sp. CB01201 TaxID=2020324 RepID=UPI000CB660A3|nr:hypothetical protein [Streptomyces sp. CB01201]PJN00837.1 hypothetical protein CG740_23320 [Streptomyces sp. CB01201]